MPVGTDSNPAWHTLTIDRTLSQLETDDKTGLTDRQIAQLQQEFGANELVAAASRQWWQILLDQFANIMLVMLIFVALISGIFDFIELQAGKTIGLPYKDTIAILSIVILNGILGYVQESRAEQALAALKRMSAPKVRVLRDSKISEIDGRELVPGDVIHLEAGNQLAADARLLEAVQLQIRESALTGEATASSKTAEPELAAETPLGDRVNLVYQGTEITTGRGVAVVTATGMNTELGKIAALLQGVESQPTPLQQKLTQLGNVLVGGALVIVALTIIGGMLPDLLGFAYRYFTDLPDADSAESELIWVGLVGMLDAPRPEVRAAVDTCKTAGIRTMMITGDRTLTAIAIGTDLGITQTDSQVVSGNEIAQMDDATLKQTIESVSVYARVAPAHKLRIVKALQQQGELVAMTGDGVNDAPALKQADIGVAMGITGTDVSKEASDMVLLDDNFNSIVAAVEEGRIVYTNIRRFIKYILGSNIGEILTIAAAPLIGLGGVPLSPLQILWMNLVTDGIPALALALEPGEPDVMQRPPFQPSESIFARGLGAYIIRIGLVFGVVTIGLMKWAFDRTHAVDYPDDPDTWKTIVFTTLVFAQMGHALAVRSVNKLVIEINPFSNPLLLWAILGTILLQLAVVYIAPLRSFFGTHPLSLFELGVCFGCSLLIFIWIEGEKLFVRWFRSKS